MPFHVNGTPIGFEAVLLATLASMGGFIFGYDTGQISDIVAMDDFKRRFAQHHLDMDGNTYYEFSVVREGLIVALLSIGTLIGAILGSYIADFLGRRKAITAETFVFSVGVLIQVTAFEAWYQVAIGRLVSGLGVGALSAAVPTYQAETAPKQIRGALIGTYQLFITFGILLAYCFAIGTRELDGSGSWRTVIALGWVFAVFLGVGILFMPESPRWLAARGEVEEARMSLARIRGMKHDSHADIVNNDLGEILARIEEERASGKGTWMECFVGHPGVPKVAYRTFMMMTLQSLQQLTGANYFFYYGVTIFNSVGIEDSFVTQIILGAVNFVCTFLGLYVMEHFGRRKPLIVGGLWQSAWLFIFASVGVACDVTQKSIGTVLIVSASLFILGYASTWAPGIWILTGETFPLRTRQKQAALATASNWLWNFLIAFFTPFITKPIKYNYGFVFAGCNLFGAIFVYFVLYESAGLSLEAVDAMYSDPSVKAWQSGSYVPVGYSSRYDASESKKGTEYAAEHLEHNGQTPLADEKAQSTPMNGGAAHDSTTSTQVETA